MPQDLTIEEMLDGADALQTGYALYSKDFKLLYANAAAEANFPALYKLLRSGVDMPTAVAAQTRAFHPDMPESALRKTVQAAIDSFKKSSRRTVALQDNRWIDTWHSPTKAGGYIAFSLDVTENVRREQALKRALDLADAGNKAKSEFLASMSHELRTPMNGIVGMAQALKTMTHDAQPKELVSVILDNSNALLTILNDILEIARLGADNFELCLTALNVRDSFASLITFFEPLAKEKNLSLRSIIDPSVPENLLVDPIRLRQCIMNLMSNAVKFTNTGAVTVALKSQLQAESKSKHLVTLYVQDTGIGIPPEKAELIFEKFTQVDGSSTRQYGGTGAGLPIARQLARMMGGDVTFSSKTGQGSIFALTFQADTVIVKNQKPATRAA